MISREPRDEDDEGTFEGLRNATQRAVDHGQLDEAVSLADRALAWARRSGTGAEMDLAVCNRAALEIWLGRGDAALPQLREILLRNGDPGSCRLAAYNISIHYCHFAKNFKKGLFYARIALERSQVLGRRDWLASSHNLLGSALLGESFVDQADREFVIALELMKNDQHVWKAKVLDNLGYCRILQKRYDEGYALLYRSLRLLRRLGVERYQIEPLLDLCLAHLETGRIRYATRKGAAGLALAEKMGDVDAIKNALYLLGEAANLDGDSTGACSYFNRLQRDHYPQSPYLTGFLLAVDVRSLINLHA
jgi:tetratricopeptide (TPR) repeat protein